MLMKGFQMAATATYDTGHLTRTDVSESAEPVAVEQLARLLRETVTRLQPSTAAISAAWSDAQITMQQLRVMTILYHDGPTRVSDLARRLGVSTPTITGILDRLVRQGATYRTSDDRDRRVVLNVLTVDGRELVEQLVPGNGDVATLALSRLSEAERLALMDALGNLLRVLDDLP
jgi:DNA-binding MarR family transcriptional regulator